MSFQKNYELYIDVFSLLCVCYEINVANVIRFLSHIQSYRVQNSYWRSES